MLDDNDRWVCLEDGDDDYVIDRFELRVHGRKPLVLNQPSFSKLMFVTQQFLHTSHETTADPFTAEEHFRLVAALEKHLQTKYWVQKCMALHTNPNLVFHVLRHKKTR